MKTTTRIILAALVLLAMSANAAAQDTSGLDTLPREDVQTVSLLLSGYHDLASFETLSQVPNARAIVEGLANGPHNLVRDRALAAMGRYWPSADVFLLYARVIAADDTPDGTRHRVILLFANVFGDRAIPAIRPFLSVQDLQLQITAVQALGRIGSDEAVAVVQEFAPRATNRVLLEQIDKSTRVLR